MCRSCVGLLSPHAAVVRTPRRPMGRWEKDSFFIYRCCSTAAATQQIPSAAGVAATSPNTGKKALSRNISGMSITKEAFRPPIIFSAGTAKGEIVIAVPETSTMLNRFVKITKNSILWTRKKTKGGKLSCST